MRNLSHPKTSYGKRSISKYFSNNFKNKNNNNTKQVDNQMNKYIKIISMKNHQYDNFIYKNRNIQRNNPGYLYYKEILNMNKTMQNKRRISAEKYISSKNNFFQYQKPKGQKYRNFNKIFDKNVKPLKDCINLHNPYMPFWITKIILNKTNNNFFRHNDPMHFMERINHKNTLLSRTKNVNLPMKNRTLDLTDKINRKNLILIPNKNKKQKPKKFFRKSSSGINIINMKKMNLLNINTNKEKEKIVKMEDDIPVDKEQEKQFYRIQKNFFPSRKEIIEEPEYLEEDS